MYQKKGCVHPKSEIGFTMHWKKVVTELHPASRYDGSYRLSKTFFDNPDGLTEEFGEFV